MHKSSRIIVFVVLVLHGTLSPADDRIDYSRQVKPILMAHCVPCHGGLKQEGGLRLDTALLALKGGDSGLIIEPGNSAASQIVARVISTDETERMPQNGDPLKADEIAVIKNWIDQNANAPADEEPEKDPREHWAFRPVTRPAIPLQTVSGWTRNPIDAFISNGHVEHGLTPQSEADRATLIRRLYIDLIGMPPTPSETVLLELDNDDDWYERLVDRLLDDRRYGERWARHWMDIWRYSDWWGLGDQLRNSQQHMWHWRDWIIESLNVDTPYDEMIRQMLAADEIYPDDLGKLRATGFLARNYFLFNRNPWMEETVEHVNKAFLGLTFNCAKCHDHKYDPISQEDYYRMRAIFETVHVRLDMVPGQVDLSRDGIPRVFDSRIDTPTYLYVRGDENHPDKSKVIAPGLPKLLASRELQIAKVPLSSRAWQPERQPWVLDNHIAAARNNLAAVESTLASAQAKLELAKQKESEMITQGDVAVTEPSQTPQSGTVNEPTGIVDDFASFDSKRWQTLGGDWGHEPGKLVQKRDGAETAALRFLEITPSDFDAMLRFTIRGGSQWRSVGIEFDAMGGKPDAASQQDSQLVYVSAYAGGSKIQAAYGKSGNWVYSNEGMRALTIEPDREYTLRVQVRGDVINASLDGQNQLAFRTPFPRQSGFLQFITFDALAEFNEVRLAPLGKDVKLIEPTTPPKTPPTTAESAHAVVVGAQAELTVAERAIEMARADLESVTRRAEAMREAWKQSDASVNEDVSVKAQADEARAAAITSERQFNLAKAQHGVATHELRLLRGAADQRPAIENELKAAREALTKAQELASGEIKPEDSFTPLFGAKWTPTRFLDSTRDDPTVAFVPESSGRRRALAEWITDARNPLAARVAVNHIWNRHFGTPLVATVFDFGRKGSLPTNPELLDWLAAELVANNWSMKHIHRLIVNSATYRMSSSSVGQPSDDAKDPDNIYWWRRNPIRLESQVVRDSILSLAGTLDLTSFGPPVPPAQQADSMRRSLYFFHSNNERNLFLSLFDEALVKECYRRDQSIVPQQALALVNSRMVLDAATRIADRIASEAPSTDSETGTGEFVRRAFVEILSIEPSQPEIVAGLSAIKKWSSEGTATHAQARAYFVWSLLNHNDFVTLR